MKKNRALFRSYIGAYFVWTFGAVLAALVLNAWGAAPSIIAVIVALIDVAALITSHVFYSTTKQVYAPLSFAAHGVNTVLVIVAFVAELMLTLKGKAAPYAWMISIICLLSLIPIDIFVVRENLKFMKKLKAQKEKAAARAAAAEEAPEEEAQAEEK